MEKLHIIYEDNHLIVLIKPAGIPVQQDKTNDLDLLTMVKEYIKEKYNKPGEVYIGLVHRLDRMVGGLIVFARTSKAASRLSEYIRNREFKKEYLAIVNGRLTESQELTHYLVKNERLNKSSVVTKETKDAKQAILKYDVLENFNYQQKEYTKVKVDLKTGRHHQIRVQFASIDHPLYGDVKYGQKVNKVGQNLALWSCYLSFYHPTQDAYLEFRFTPDQMVEEGSKNKLYSIDKIWMV